MRTLNKLTPAKVAKQKEPGRYADGAGLYLQVSKYGNSISKQWLFRFMLDGRARQMGLGSARTFSLAEARQRAEAARKLAADRIDPIEQRLARRDAERKEERERITFKEAAEKFISLHSPGWRNAKHRQQWTNTLASYAYPQLGTRPVKAIDAALINETLAPIWLKIPDSAKRVRGRIERVCQWVKDGMPLPAPSAAERVRSHPALPYQELPAFMVELRAHEGMSARALEYLILTAARTAEVIGATWDEIDLEGKVWTVPGKRMKAGKTHRVPLSATALDLLRTLPRERGNKHVFLSGREGKPLSNMAMLELMRRMRPGCVPHGFRSSFKDWCREQTNYPNAVSEAALAHSIKDKVEAAYARGDLLEKRRKLMSDWARYCEKPQATVTPMRKTA